MHQTESKMPPRFRRLITLLGVGPHLLLLGVILEGFTILLLPWVSIPISIPVAIKIALTILLVSACLLGMVLFNRTLDLVERHLLGGEKKLVTNGLFAYVRHPLYAILMATLPPLFIIWYSDLIFAISWIFIYLVFHRIVRLEERGLINTFGEAYVTYRQSVPALIPYRGLRRVNNLDEQS